MGEHVFTSAKSKLAADEGSGGIGDGHDAVGAPPGNPRASDQRNHRTLWPLSRGAATGVAKAEVRGVMADLERGDLAFGGPRGSGDVEPRRVVVVGQEPQVAGGGEAAELGGDLDPVARLGRAQLGEVGCYGREPDLLGDRSEIGEVGIVGRSEELEVHRVPQPELLESPESVGLRPLPRQLGDQEIGAGVDDGEAPLGHRRRPPRPAWRR
jgi:hypothetical protein